MVDSDRIVRSTSRERSDVGSICKTAWLYQPNRRDGSGRFLRFVQIFKNRPARVCSNSRPMNPPSVCVPKCRSSFSRAVNRSVPGCSVMAAPSWRIEAASFFVRPQLPSRPADLPRRKPQHSSTISDSGSSCTKNVLLKCPPTPGAAFLRPRLTAQKIVLPSGQQDVSVSVPGVTTVPHVALDDALACLGSSTARRWRLCSRPAASSEVTIHRG